MKTLIAGVLGAMLSLGAQAQSVRVVDGDTLRVGGERVRIMGLDTPETSARCPQEAALARQATAHMRQLVAQGITPELGSSLTTRVCERARRVGGIRAVAAWWLACCISSAGGGVSAQQKSSKPHLRFPNALSCGPLPSLVGRFQAWAAQC